MKISKIAAAFAFMLLTLNAQAQDTISAKLRTDISQIQTTQVRVGRELLRSSRMHNYGYALNGIGAACVGTSIIMSDDNHSSTSEVNAFMFSGAAFSLLGFVAHIYANIHTGKAGRLLINNNGFSISIAN